jgi:O-antigen ligase
MAIMGVVCFGSIFIKNFSISSRVFAGLISALNLALIYRSNARQGMLAFLLGIGIFLTIWLLSWRKKMGIIAITFGSITFAFAVLGMLQIGPLEKLLYKSSVTVRGYYWRAGIEMFKDRPFTGIGVDRYGAYFKEFREAGYPLKYGFEITSSNAHNTLIQLFSTAGIFVGLSYIAILFYVLISGLKIIKNTDGDKQKIILVLLTAWIGFQAQSLISIDNIGISVWGWLLGGSILGLSRKNYGSSEVSLSKIKSSRHRFRMES